MGRIERCETCRWWSLPRDNGYASGMHVGSCRRHPPVLMKMTDDEDDEPHEDPAFWGFPAVIEGEDYCGEWTPQPTTPG